MALVKRNAVEAPTLRKETVEVPEIGGDVVVRAMLLGERLEIFAAQKRLAVPRDGESEEDAHERAGRQLIAPTLACTVLDAESKPLWTTAEWNVFGSQHAARALHLFRVVMRLSGGSVEDVRKN